jgi:transposase
VCWLALGDLVVTGWWVWESSGVSHWPGVQVSSVAEERLRPLLADLLLYVRVLEEGQERSRELARAREEGLAAELAAERARADALAVRVEDLARRLARDSSNSSRPPSSDGPYRKPRDRSLRQKTGRKAGKQPGAPSVTLRQSPDPDQTLAAAPAACGGCGHDLSGVPVLAEQKRQVFEAAPPPPPRVTEYLVQSKACPCCGQVSTGQAPAGVTGRVQYGPGVHARAALAVCAHYLPVRRAAALTGALTGVKVSAGFTASVRGRAAVLLVPFLDRVRGLLGTVPVLYADETPARAAGKLRYVHVACTEFLTAMHTGDRTKDTIDAGQVLPGYTGTIVRDGYAGYGHLTAALHAWCGAHSLRDLNAIFQADPAGQSWAAGMARVLLDAKAAAGAARAAGRTRLDEDELKTIRDRYRAAACDGIQANQDRRTGTGRDAMTLAMRFGRHEDMILRFAADLAVGFTSNQAERDIRPVKIAQHTAGGTWRTLLGLADFAIVRSYLSTAAKWGIQPLDALTQLFTAGPWLPSTAAPG